MPSKNRHDTNQQFCFGPLVGLREIFYDEIHLSAAQEYREILVTLFPPIE